MKYAHTNIVAKDWKALSKFYVDVFDCKVKPPERDLSGDWLDKATGLTHAHLKGIHLILPGFEDYGPTLEIFTYQDMNSSQPIMANHIGFTHIAFQVDDVEKTFEKAIKNGGSVLGKVTRKEVEGVGLLTLVYFRDPEGNIVEIQSWE
ncbi:MAG: VOC family protein [Desulfobacteraceae bacterium]|nr:VOC family protein [Desulfobacteraceae bacterium]